jgi:hypothetical protein
LKLTQIVEQGKLDGGESTLMELKLLEAEVAYERARRLKDSWSLGTLVFGVGYRQRHMSHIDELRLKAIHIRSLADNFEIPFAEAAKLYELYPENTAERESAALRQRKARDNSR